MFISQNNQKEYCEIIESTCTGRNSKIAFWRV